MRPSALTLALVLAATSVGCAGGLKLTPIKSTSGKPSNVAVYFRVEEGKDKPIGGLSAENFRIYEDDQLVSQHESKQTILNPEVAASHYTLLLVDMSGSISSDPEATKTLVEAATAFTERVQKDSKQKVAVYAFDGSENLTPIVPFSSGSSAQSGVQSLAAYKPKDPSTNLNGAVIAGLGMLEHALEKAEQPLKFGTLVVFSDGTDRAHRVSEADMLEAVKSSKYEVFAIGLGTELSEQQLKAIGKDGTARADKKDEVVKAFDDIAARIEGRTKSYYLLSYCSPARAGKHEVRIEAVVAGPDGKGEKRGSLRQQFDAAGFTHGCDPNTPPPFDIHKGDALAPKEKDDKAKPPKPAVKVEGGASLKVGATTGGGATTPPPPPKEQFTP